MKLNSFSKGNITEPSALWFPKVGLLRTAGSWQCWNGKREKNELHDSSIQFESSQHWSTQWKNLKDILYVCVFVMFITKSSLNPTNAFKLRCWVCGPGSLTEANIAIQDYLKTEKLKAMKIILTMHWTKLCVI